jgi:hypothetical protein
MFALPLPRYEALPGYREALANVDSGIRAEALERFMGPFKASFEQLVRGPGPDYEARIAERDPELKSLQTDGFALLKADAALKSQLKTLVAPTAEEITARIDCIERPRFRDGQVLFNRAEQPDAYALIDSILRAAQLPVIASAYAGAPLKLSAVALQVNTERSTRIRYGRIDEEGIPEEPAAYFHIDSAVWPHQKVLIYLDNVGLDEGPFRYVPGSHRVADAFELAVRKTNDRLGMSREMFMALSEPFRVYAEFGAHLDQNGPEARDLLAREVAVYDDAGSDLIIFDYHGVHRGGFVRRGARHMLQCTFRAIPQV